MKNIKQIFREGYAPAVAVLWNILLVYAVYQMARLEYYLENADYLTYTSDIFRG